jgi:hypothetical protein
MPIDRDGGKVKMRPGPNHLPEDRVSFLGVRVMMMVVAVMVMRGGECRGGKHHQKQGGCKNLFHAKNVARTLGREKCIPDRASKEARGGKRFQYKTAPPMTC